MATEDRRGPAPTLPMGHPTANPNRHRRLQPAAGGRVGRHPLCKVDRNYRKDHQNRCYHVDYGRLVGSEEVAENPQWKGLGSSAGRECRDNDLVERQGESKQPTSKKSRTDERESDVSEGLE